MTETISASPTGFVTIGERLILGEVRVLLERVICELLI